MSYPVGMVGVAVPLSRPGLINQVPAAGRISIIFCAIVSIAASAGGSACQAIERIIGKVLCLRTAGFVVFDPVDIANRIIVVFQVEQGVGNRIGSAL